MYMDAEFPINLAQVSRVVEEAEVFVIGFMIFGERLLVDTRTSPEEGPLIKVVPGVSSVEERYETLRELRPYFPLPDRFVFLVWPSSVANLKRQGIWEKLVARYTALGDPQAEQVCQEAFDELVRLEGEQVLAALKGEGYKSIWERDKG
jgi:hypothetical protein